MDACRWRWPSHVEADSPRAASAPRHVTHVKARCQVILRADGLTPIDAEADSGWSLLTLVRLSLNDSTSGDITVVDLPLTFSFETPGNGQIKLNSNSSQALAAILAGINDAALPTCRSAQLVRIRLDDPAGLRFAVLGVSTRDKGE